MENNVNFTWTTNVPEIRNGYVFVLDQAQELNFQGSNVPPFSGRASQVKSVSGPTANFSLNFPSFRLPGQQAGTQTYYVRVSPVRIFNNVVPELVNPVSNPVRVDVQDH